MSRRVRAMTVWFLITAVAVVTLLTVVEAANPLVPLVVGLAIEMLLVRAWLRVPVGAGGPGGPDDGGSDDGGPEPSGDRSPGGGGPPGLEGGVALPVPPSGGHPPDHVGVSDSGQTPQVGRARTSQ